MTTVTSSSRNTASALGWMALLSLSACAPQTQTVPEVDLPEPTKNVWRAAAEGDTTELAANRRAGVDLDGLMPGAAQVTPLTVAVVTGQWGSVKWLLANGAGANATNGDGGTVLGTAAFLGRAEMAKMLIDAGADTSIRNDAGQSALDIARLDWATTEYIATMLKLPVERAEVEAGRAKIIAMLGGTPIDDWGALAGVIVNDDARALKQLLGKGADPNARDPRNGTTALILAAFLGRVDIAKMLLVAGADMNAKNNDGATALSVAELDRATTGYFASMFGIPIPDPDAVEKGKGEIARMLRAKL
ncbi:MAG: ankyrin repeat domain-containing protein [Gammaproteobacteria bacterium]|nr:ankyrin repeat domain-containing protein [Gammaproteobacteria bacterium]